MSQSGVSPRLSALFIYPIKAGRAVVQAQALVEPRGLQGDRRLMVVDPRGDFVSQRECAALRQLDTSMSKDGGGRGVARSITLRAPGQSALDVVLDDGPRRAVSVWGDRVDAVDLGDSSAKWLSTWLGRDVRLVSMPPDARRRVDPDFAESSEEVVSFADGFPLLLISESSVEALGQQLTKRGEAAVASSRFRANLVVSGAPAFAEDQWTHVKIGEVRFRVAKPCSRCVVTTIDQEGGEHDSTTSLEPLATLATFRKRPGGVMFGQNLVPCGAGTIRIGDPVVPILP